MAKEMTYLDKIRKFVSMAGTLGGTHVWPSFGKFQMAFGERSGSAMYLYDVDGSNAYFCKFERGTDRPDMESVWNMPLAWFSEFILRQIFIELKFAARQTLDDAIYDIIRETLGEER